MFLLEGVLLDGLVGLTIVTSSCKIVKRHGLRLHGDFELVVEFSIFEVGGKAKHKEKGSNFMEGLEEEGGFS